MSDPRLMMVIIMAASGAVALIAVGNWRAVVVWILGILAGAAIRQLYLVTDERS
jgi:hypothetical protein